MRRKPDYDAQRGDWKDVRRGAWRFIRWGKSWITTPDCRPCRWLDLRAERADHVKRTYKKRVDRSDHIFLHLRDY